MTTVNPVAYPFLNEGLPPKPMLCRYKRNDQWAIELKSFKEKYAPNGVFFGNEGLVGLETIRSGSKTHMFKIQHDGKSIWTITQMWEKGVLLYEEKIYECYYEHSNIEYPNIIEKKSVDWNSDIKSFKEKYEGSNEGLARVGTLDDGSKSYIYKIKLEGDSICTITEMWGESNILLSQRIHHESYWKQ